MRVLFATYLYIQGQEFNVEQVNGNNVAIIAMGSPFRTMFNKSEDIEQELADLVYDEKVIDNHLPELDGIVILDRDQQRERVINLVKHFQDCNPLGQVHIVTNISYMGRPYGVFEAVYHYYDGEGSPVFMQMLLQRYLALGSLNGRSGW